MKLVDVPWIFNIKDDDDGPLPHRAYVTMVTYHFLRTSCASRLCGDQLENCIAEGALRLHDPHVFAHETGEEA